MFHLPHDPFSHLSQGCSTCGKQISKGWD